MVSKCLATCGNSLFLSEINPMIVHGSVRFAPMDLISQLEVQYKVLSEQDRKDFFEDQMRVLNRVSTRLGRPICLRDHTHSSFLRRKDVGESEMLEELKELGYSTLSVTTVRHPVDAFVGMIRENWAKGVDDSLDKYCRRVIQFLDYCDRSGIRIWRYEDFCLDPQTVLQQMCEALDIAYNPDFLTQFGNIRLSGDSGRSSAQISLRERRPIDDAVADQVLGSDAYYEICTRMDYAPTLDAHPLKGRSWAT